MFIFFTFNNPQKPIYCDSNTKTSLECMKTILRKLYAEIENVSDGLWENEL